MFRGSMVALVTPLCRNGAVDVDALRALVAFHIQEGTHAIIAGGTTGESGTLTHDEKRLVIEVIIDAASERIPVIAGTGANSTQAATELTHLAMTLGAHAALIMTPAYIRPTQEGLYEHYARIADAVPIPIILYNVPSRTACDLLPETVVRLAKIANIIGIKEATDDKDRLATYIEAGIDVYDGNDGSGLDWMLSGAKGVMSVTANVAPRLMAQCCEAALDGNVELANTLNEKLLPLHKALFLEANPIPVKWALHQMGKIEDVLRLPLTSLSSRYHASLKQVLDDLSLS